MEEKFNHYSFGEGRTGGGQLVEFTFPVPAGNNEEKDEVAENIREFLKTQIRDIDIPAAKKVNISRGSYGQYSRYDIKQHKYAGGGHPGAGGYKEVLEIKNPPDGRWGIVINEYISPGRGAFTEWETLKDAKKASAKYWCLNEAETKLAKSSGFKRRVVCGALTPWFYAIGDEELIGDYAFPEGFQDDPVYRFGRQFVVFDSDKIPTIKTCMGTRFLHEKARNYYPYYEREGCHYRLVHWDDGSVWKDGFNSSAEYSPRPVEESELWITEAIQQFRQLLVGKKTEFTVNFTDGKKFIGKLAASKCHITCAEGRYLLVVNIKGESKSRQGWVEAFKPTPEYPDIIKYVTAHYAKINKQVDRIEIKESRVKKGGKKWAGVFFSSPD